MIAPAAVAMTGAMRDRLDEIRSYPAWFEANSGALLLGVAVALGLVAIMLVLRQLGARVSRSDPAMHSWRTVIGRVLAKTSLAFMVVAALDIVSTYTGPPPRFARLVDIAFIIAFALQAAVWARELILGVIGHRAGDGPDETALGNAAGVIRVLVSIAVFALAIIFILDNLGVNVTALVAGLGIGGIAIGLAAQGIFSDLFAALAILFDKPFKRGDTIRYDNSTGTVERIGLKTTRLRSLTGEQLIMANTKLLEREIHNLAQAKARRMTLHFSVTSASPAADLPRIEAAAAAATDEQKGCKMVRCALTGVASGAISHELVYDDSARDNNRIALNRSGVLRALIEGLAAEGLEIVRASDLAAPPAPL